MLADIALAGSTEESVRGGVTDDVRVGMAGQP
jgi:hypothetical protein